MLSTLIFPIEYFTGALSSAGAWLAGLFYSDGVSSTKMFSILGVTVKPAAKAIISFLGSKAIIVIPASVILLFISLRGLSVMLKKILIGKSQKNLEKYVFGNLSEKTHILKFVSGKRALNVVGGKLFFKLSEKKSFLNTYVQKLQFVS